MRHDAWKWTASSDDVLAALPHGGRLIVPLADWQTLREQLLSGFDGMGVWLRGEDDPAAIARDFAHLELIAVHFASFTDGRGYSTARLLRERYGWRGELRAVGDIQRDQLLYLARCGFDTFVLPEGGDTEAALAAFDEFSEVYQAAVEPPLPLYRRREQAQL